MSRFRIPARLGPSPASEEPGQQNAAARLRSSRETQSRILAERRGAASEAAPDLPMAALGEISGMPGKREGEDVAVVTDAPGGPRITTAAQKVKVVIVFRVALVLQTEIEDLARKEGLSKDYVLAALAKEGRDRLRGLANTEDVAPISAAAATFRALPDAAKSIGESRTVYVRQDGLAAMHKALGDPWQALPRATIVGAYFAAILTRLVNARREG